MGYFVYLILYPPIVVLVVAGGEVIGLKLALVRVYYFWFSVDKAQK